MERLRPSAATHAATQPSTPPKRALAPDLRRMTERSVRAWVEAMAVSSLGSGRYRVEGESGRIYTVDLPEGVCTCPDRTIRGERCKHLRRVAIEVNEGRLPPPGAHRERCASCNHERIVPEDRVPPLCEACHLDTGDVVIDRETGDTLAVVEVTDRPADAVHITDAGKTVAEYPENDGYPADDLVVEAVYPFSGPPEIPFDELPRYAFPRSRLERRDEHLVR